MPASGRTGLTLAPMQSPEVLSLPFEKYRPDQPRAPRGTPDGGQWVDEGLGGGGSGSGDGHVISDVLPDDVFQPGAQVAQNDSLSGYPIDLREEEGLGGHTIERHVNVSRERLERRLRAYANEIVDRGDEFEGISQGSFTSLEAATKLANSTVSRNKVLVDEVARGDRAFAMLRSRFGSVTGFEIYLPSYHSEPFFRETYGVSVFIVRDVRLKKGYRVQSAFPSQ